MAMKTAPRRSSAPPPRSVACRPATHACTPHPPPPCRPVRAHLPAPPRPKAGINQDEPWRSIAYRARCVQHAPTPGVRCGKNRTHVSVLPRLASEGCSLIVPMTRPAPSEDALSPHPTYVIINCAGFAQPRGAREAGWVPSLVYLRPVAEVLLIFSLNVIGPPAHRGGGEGMRTCRYVSVVLDWSVGSASLRKLHAVWEDKRLCVIDAVQSAIVRSPSIRCTACSWAWFPLILRYWPASVSSAPCLILWSTSPSVSCDELGLICRRCSAFVTTPV